MQTGVSPALPGRHGNAIRTLKLRAIVSCCYLVCASGRAAGGKLGVKIFAKAIVVAALVVEA